METEIRRSLRPPSLLLLHVHRLKVMFARSCSPLLQAQQTKVFSGSTLIRNDEKSTAGGVDMRYGHLNVRAVMGQRHIIRAHRPLKSREALQNSKAEILTAARIGPFHEILHRFLNSNAFLGRIAPVSLEKIEGYSQKRIFTQISNLLVPIFVVVATKNYSKNSAFLPVLRRFSRCSAPYRTVLARVAGFGQDLLPLMSSQANLTTQSTWSTAGHHTRLLHGPDVQPPF